MENMKKYKRRILIIDDNELDSNFLSLQLGKRNFESIVLNDINNAFEIISKNNIEIVLLDVLMPLVDGNTFLTEIRTKFNSFELPVIMITALSESENLVKSIQLGANDHITKPVSLDIAVARINNQLITSDLHKDNLKRRELDIINSMMITYNHEINNSLAIASMALKRIEQKLSESDMDIFNKAKNALKRIEEIVKKIQDIEKLNKIELVPYADNPNNKMLK